MEQIHSKTKKSTIVEPRQLLAYILRTFSNKSISLYSVGAIINRDHADVLHCVKVINNTMDTNKRKKLEYEAIFQKIYVICSGPEQKVSIKEFIDRLTQFPEDTPVYVNGAMGLNIIMIKEVIVDDVLNLTVQ